MNALCVQEGVEAEEMRLKWVLMAVGLVIPLVWGGGAYWHGQGRSWATVEGGAMLGEPVESEPVGTVHTSAVLEREWASWEGGYKLFASSFAGISREADLRGRQLLIPAFTLGPVGAEDVELMRRRAAAFAGIAGMTIAEEPRAGYFRARLLSEQQSVALLPNALSEALGVDTAPGLNRLLPSTLKEKGGA